MDIITGYITGNIPQILTILLGVILGGSLGALVVKCLKVLKEVGELLNVLVQAVYDKKLTQNELDKIIKEAKDVKKAFNNKN